MLGPLLMMGASGGSVGGTYGDLIVSQGGTHYWPLQTARTATEVEPDEIGAADITMTSGDVALSGDGPFAGSDSVQFTAGDTEGMGGNVVSLNLNQDWSLSLWFKMQTTASTVPMVVTIAESGAYLFLIHRDDRGGLTLQSDVGGATFMDFGTGRNIENDGLWHHIGVTREYSTTASDDTITTWLDGVQSSQYFRSGGGFPLSFNTDGIFLANRSVMDLGITGRMAHVAFAAGTVWGSTEISAQEGYAP